MPVLFSAAGSSDPVNPNPRKRAASRRGKDIEEEEAPVPKARAVSKSAPSAKPGKRSNYAKMALHKYIEYREVNPYLSPRSPQMASSGVNAWFYTPSQVYVFQDCYGKKLKPVPEQRAVDVDYMRKNPGYFGEALEMCEKFGLLPIMQVQCDYVQKLIAQFYATVYMGVDDARTLTWMTKNKVLSCSWARFAQLLGYKWRPDPEKTGVNGWRVHDNSKCCDPVVLAPLYIEGSKYKPGLIKNLKPVYDIMNRVYLNTIAVKGGNFDAIHSFHIDLMLQTYLHKDVEGPEAVMDVMDVLWNDLWLTILDRQSCSYGPYFMLMIVDAWSSATDGEDLWESIRDADITPHRVRRPKVKDHNPFRDEDPKLKDTVMPDMPEIDEEEDSDADPDYDPVVQRPVEEPSWFKKLMGKLHKSFCLKVDLQERMYEEHARAKKDRQRQKQILRHLQLPVSDGSEGIITPKEKWISSHRWSSDDEAGAGPSSSAGGTGL